MTIKDKIDIINASLSMNPSNYKQCVCVHAWIAGSSIQYFSFENNDEYPDSSVFLYLHVMPCIRTILSVTIRLFGVFTSNIINTFSQGTLNTIWMYFGSFSYVVKHYICTVVATSARTATLIMVMTKLKYHPSAWNRESWYGLD